MKRGLLNAYDQIVNKVEDMPVGTNSDGEKYLEWKGLWVRVISL